MESFGGMLLLNKILLFYLVVCSANWDFTPELLSSTFKYRVL